MKCPQCGHDNSEDAQFCGGCGTSLSAPTGEGLGAETGRYKREIEEILYQAGELGSLNDSPRRISLKPRLPLIIILVSLLLVGLFVWNVAGQTGWFGDLGLFSSFAAARAYKTGTEYLAQGRYKEAIEEFNEAVRRDSRKAKAYYSRAFAYAELGQYEQVIQNLDEAIRLNPNDTDSYQLRGQTYQILGIFKEAERDFARARATGNLVPYAPRGWEAPLVVSRNLCSGEYTPRWRKVENIDLLPNEDTYISWAEDYTGPSQIEHISYTDLLFDGVVVERWTGNNLDPSQYSVIDEWEGLSGKTRVTAGEHTLTLIVDSTNLVPETNEDDNVFTRCFTWATAEHEPITPQDMSRAPDLVPFADRGWSDPIVATSYKGAAADGPLSVDVPNSIWYGVQNRGLSSTSERFWVYLYLDDILVDMISWDGMLVDDFGSSEEWGELSDVTNVVRGTHTLKVVVDATDLVVESDEGNNVFEKKFTWGSGPVAAMPIETPIPTPIPAPPPSLTLPNLVPRWSGPDTIAEQELTVYTNEELQQMLSNLQGVLDIRDYALTISSTDNTDAVLTVAEAGYYLITGKSLQDEMVNIFLLTHDESLQWIDDDFSEELATSEESEHPAILARREKYKTEFIGYTTRHSGRVAIVVDAERPVAKVINTLVHELGHMRARLLNPSQTGESYSLAGIREAQAQQFERTFWLTVEDFTGRSLIAYPDFGDFHELIDHRFQTWEAERDSSEHALGWLLQWLVVLDDPKLSDLRVELVETGRLGAESSVQLYDYLVALAPEVVDSYVSNRLDSREKWRPTILEISKLRLVPLHELQIEGAAALRDPALMAP